MGHEWSSFTKTRCARVVAPSRNSPRARASFGKSNGPNGANPRIVEAATTRRATLGDAALLHLTAEKCRNLLAEFFSRGPMAPRFERDFAATGFVVLEDSLE